MSASDDKKEIQFRPGSTAELLSGRREAVLQKFIQEVKKNIPAASREPEPVIVNTLPVFVENLCEALANNFPRNLASEGTTVASEHGGERARLTRYSPQDLIKEYQILRDVLFEELGEAGQLRQQDQICIIKSIDLAMSQSLMSYFLINEGLREQMSVTITHDLRTPLTAIKAASDLILRLPEVDSKVQSLAAKISTNVMRIDRMTEDLLNASRTQFGQKIPYEVEEFDLWTLIQDTVGLLALNHGNRFELNGASIVGFWNMDAFRRAIENVLDNAVKYGDDQPIKVRLLVSHGRAIFSVHNSGPHIPAENQENLFKSFMRSDSALKSSKQGWGLGLTMVRGMAEGHGGSIAVDSSPERGTTFTIDVPVDSRPFLDHPSTPGT